MNDNFVTVVLGKGGHFFPYPLFVGYLEMIKSFVEKECDFNY